MSHHVVTRGLFVALLIAALTQRASAEPSHTLTIFAGDEPRRGVIVRFEAPADLAKQPWALRAPVGDYSPPFTRGVGNDAFVRVDLPAGGSVTYDLVLIEPGKKPAVAPPDVVTADGENNVIDFAIAGRPLLRYQGALSPLPDGYDASLHRGGYLHPIYTPGGRIVTDDYPPNHKHHHGVFAPWTKTLFEGREPDFWNMGDKKGRVEFVKLGGVASGPLAAQLVAHHRFVDLTAKPDPKPALEETWTVTVYPPVAGDVPLNVFDLDLTQTASTDSPLMLPKYYYGGLGFRGSREWDGKGNCVFLTSEGKDVTNGNETTGRWCYVGGKVSGQPAGIVILCHPSNFRAPQPMRLHPTEPFFCFAPSQGGDWEISREKPYAARYRFLVMDSPPDAKLIQSHWRQYANPPRVEIR